MERREAWRLYQSDVGAFSRDVIRVPLYRYQVTWAQYALEAIAERRNEVIIVIMPRQSGKNEARAQLEVCVLARHGRKGGELVVAAPTFKPQIINSKMRFEARAQQAAERMAWLKAKPAAGYMYRLGRAGISFFSAEPKASVVGATASLALEVDEVQDVDPAKFDKDFSPMRASTGAPVIACGTTWSDTTLLERFIKDIDEGRVNGRVFRVTPERVGEENKWHWEYVQAETKRLGREHPLIKTQYYLELLPNKGRLLTTQQLRMMVGDHARAERRTNEPVIVAGLDWAGADEDAGEISSLGSMSKRDSVALSIGAVSWARPGPMPKGLDVWEPVVRCLARYEWTNVHPLSLESTLMEILHGRWRVNRVHADNTGIGATGTARLGKLLDAGTGLRVQGVMFDSAWKTQTDLAFQYIQVVNGARFLDYKPSGFDPIEVAGREAPDTSDPDKHVWWQRGHARLETRTGQRVRVSVPEGEGHDDLMVADMLMVDAAMAMAPAAGSEQVQQQRRAAWN